MQDTTPFQNLDLDALRAGVRRADSSSCASDDAREQEAGGPAWFGFWQWCQRRGLADAALPLHVHVLVEWLAWAVDELVDDELAETLAAIRQRHIDAGLREHIEALGA